ncbi:unnamed protein product [Closterium sp. NIES-53]
MTFLVTTNFLSRIVVDDFEIFQPLIFIDSPAHRPCCPRATPAAPAPPLAARVLPLQPARRPCSLLAAPAARASPLAARSHPLAVHSPPFCSPLAPPCLRRPATAPACDTAAAGGGSAGSATGAGGAGRATGSARGAAGARGAGPTTDRHCLSWPLSWQLQQLEVDSGGHCLFRTTPPLSSFASGFFSKSVQVAEALFFYAASPGPSLAEALHTFTLDSGASRCFFRDCNLPTPLAGPVPVSLADPTGGPVVARASTLLPCPAFPSVSLSGLHLPTFSTNLVSNGAIQDVWDDTFIPGGQRVAIYQVAASSQVSASSQLATSCSLCTPVSSLPRSLPSLPRSPAPPCLPCIEGRQRPTPVGGTDQERYFLLVVNDYTRYTTIFPLRDKADASGVLIPWNRATRCQLRDRFSRDLPVLRLHSDRGGEFSSDLLAELCQDEGIVQSFTLSASPWIVERRIGLIMEVARTSMIHAAAPHFLWPLAVQYAAHQLNLWPRVFEPETSPTLQLTGKAGDALVFWVWGALSLVRDAKANKLSSRTLRCVFPHRRPAVAILPPALVSNPPPLVEPLEVSSDSSGHAEGGDPAADDTAATRRSPRLETPPGFPSRLSLPPPQLAAMDYGAETTGAEPGGAETEGEGSGGAGSGGAMTGGAGSWGAATGGPGAGQPPQPDLLETLSPQAIRAWIVRRGSPGGGGYGPAGAGAASPGGTAGAGGATSAGGTRGAAGVGGAGATSPRGATDAGGAGPTSPGGTVGAGGAAGARGARARGTGGVGTADPGGACTGGAGAAGAGGAVRAGGATGATGAGGTAGAGGAGGAEGATGVASIGGTGGTSRVGGARAGGIGGTRGAGAAGPGGARTRGTGAPGAGGAVGAGGAIGATGTGGAGGTTGARGPCAAGASGAAGSGGAAGAASAGGAGAAGAGGARAAGTALRIPFFYPQPQLSLPPPDSVLRQVLSLPSSTSLPLPLLCPLTDQSQPQLVTGSLLPARAPHTKVTESLTERLEPETRSSTPVHARHRVVLPEPPASSLPHVPDPEFDLLSTRARAACPTVTRLLATVVTDPDLESTAAFALVIELVDFVARGHLDYVASLVTESEFVCPPSIGVELALGSDALEDRQFELECLAAALPRFESMLLCPEGDPNALDIPTPRS